MPKAIRVVLIGDFGDTSAALTAQLREGGYEPEIRCVEREIELAAALDQKWDIAISCCGHNTFGALEALRVLQEKEIDLPLIVVSGRIRRLNVVALLKAGAADHLTRSDLGRLNAAVERELRASRVRQEHGQLEEQVRQAQKMEAVGRLAGGVAHDFNNLLTIITGYSDLLLSNRTLDPKVRTALEEIRRAAERGGALTHQLLTFSRREPVQTRAVQINELMMQTQKMLRRLIGEDIDLVILPTAGRDTVETDPGKIEQVIMNLVVNARDAMPHGGKLTIETATTELNEQFSARSLGVKPGSYVMMSITDTGIGMDRETQSHLFEPFFTTKAAGRGTGLGLATAYSIVRQSGGAIAILSEPGMGTTVRIYLPLAESHGAPSRAEQPQAHAPSGAETILLVEDEARVRKLLCGVLGNRGYNVLEASRGEEAVRLCAVYAGPIHLLVADVVMPEMNGPELVRQVTAARPEVRVLYMSGYTDEAIVHHGVLDSGAAFLQKPFLPDALARKVREVLDSRASATPD